MEVEVVRETVWPAVREAMVETVIRACERESDDVAMKRSLSRSRSLFLASSPTELLHLSRAFEFEFGT